MIIKIWPLIIAAFWALLIPATYIDSQIFLNPATRNLVAVQNPMEAYLIVNLTEVLLVSSGIAIGATVGQARFEVLGRRPFLRWLDFKQSPAHRKVY